MVQVTAVGALNAVPVRAMVQVVAAPSVTDAGMQVTVSVRATSSPSSLTSVVAVVAPPRTVRPATVGSVPKVTVTVSMSSTSVSVSSIGTVMVAVRATFCAPMGMLSGEAVMPAPLVALPGDGERHDDGDAAGALGARRWRR